MEENKEMLELLKQIKEENHKQVVYARIICAAAIVAALCFVGMFLLVYNFLPQIDQILTEIPGLVAQLEMVLGNLEEVTENMTKVDFSTLIDGVNTLVATGQSSLEETVEKLNSIDFAALNKAIKNLEAVVEPMAKFFKVFG